LTLTIDHYILDARLWCNIPYFHFSFYSLAYFNEENIVMQPQAIHYCVGDEAVIIM